MSEYSTFLLLDAAMMADTGAKPWTKVKRRSKWILPLYERNAWAVSPVLVDIEAAYLANRINAVTYFVSQIKPQLHASFIDTQLSAFELTEHLRQFTYFVDDKGSEFTLRIADSVVLPWLQRVMTPPQWAAFHKPILRWSVHDRDGKLRALPAPEGAQLETLPLRFSEQQLEALDECHQPEQLVHNLRMMRFGYQWAETPQREAQLAEELLRVWRNAGQSDSTTLVLFARGVFDTNGRLLLNPSLREILAQGDVTLVREGIQQAVASEKSGGSCVL